MAGYRDELERLGFSGEEKAELARRLAAGRPTAEWLTWRASLGGDRWDRDT